MKNLIKTLAVGAFALTSIGTSAIAGEQKVLIVPNPVRCTECGAVQQIVIKPMKNNTVQFSLQHPGTANPKVR